MKHKIKIILSVLLVLGILVAFPIPILFVLISGIIIGILVAFPISLILLKRHKKKITENATEKILKQEKANFQTREGKSISLNFRNDGKEVDLKKQVKEKLIKTKIKEIKGYKDEIREIKKSKKLMKPKKSQKKK